MIHIAKRYIYTKLWSFVNYKHYPKTQEPCTSHGTMERTSHATSLFPQRPLVHRRTRRLTGFICVMFFQTLLTMSLFVRGLQVDPGVRGADGRWRSVSWRSGGKRVTAALRVLQHSARHPGAGGAASRRRRLTPPAAWADGWQVRN